MDRELMDTKWIQLEAMEDSPDVNWNWDVPYRVRDKNVGDNESDLGHAAKSQQKAEWEDHTRLKEILSSARGSHRKHTAKSYTKDDTRHKAYRSKDRVHRGKLDEKALMTTIHRQTPWSVIGPKSAPTTPYLPCTLPDSLMQEYLHQS